jgi:hypothetical protein
MSDEEITAALAGIRSRLDALASINAANILLPSGPQERYHAIIEEAYAALGLIETEIDTLRVELEHQHARLDEARDAALAEATTQEQPPKKSIRRPFDVYLKTLDALKQSGQLSATFDQEAYQPQEGDIYIIEVRLERYTIHRWDGESWQQLGAGHSEQDILALVAPMQFLGESKGHRLYYRPATKQEYPT